MVVIQFFYETWKVICAISVLGSCASVIPLIKWGKGNNRKYISGTLLAIFIVVAGFSALIGNSCVKVPNVTNIMSVDNASQTLTELGLKVQLRDGKVLSDFENTVVTYQSINGELVFKGTWKAVAEIERVTPANAAYVAHAREMVERARKNDFQRRF